MTAELCFSGLALARGARRVVGPVDGVLRAGRVTAILGPNGAGKSSLLHSLAGLEPAMTGDVTLVGTSLRAIGMAERARRIGFLPQGGELHWNLSVRALVGLGRLPIERGPTGKPDHPAVEQAMADMDIAGLAERPVMTLSGGEQARALLARVLAGEPEWLLADEPLASLDPAHQLAVLARLKAAADRGVGVIVVLHDINQAARIADHVLLMKEGAILAEGPPAEVLTPQWLEQAFAVPFRRIEGEDTAFLMPEFRFGRPGSCP